MTYIKARYSRDGYSIVSTGHAGTSESCTAISAILGALAGWVKNNAGGAFSLGKGEAMIAFPKGGGAETAMDVTVIGLQQVAKVHPEDVNIELTWE